MPLSEAAADPIRSHYEQQLENAHLLTRINFIFGKHNLSIKEILSKYVLYTFRKYQGICYLVHIK